MDNPEKLATMSTHDTGHKTNTTKAQQYICWAPLCVSKDK